MKSSIHLFYGIIIGVLATLCMGSIKTDKAEFKVEEIKYLGPSGTEGGVSKKVAVLKKEGWTIIDIEVDENWWYFHVGK